jgi:hypothetical protein
MKRGSTTQPYTLVEGFRGKTCQLPTSPHKSVVRYPDFLHAALRKGHVCGFH